MKTDGNNSAFALHERSDDNTEGCTHLGLTKREYFAAIAMQGLLACPMDNMIGDMEAWDYKSITECSVRAADSLITELNKTPNEN